MDKREDRYKATEDIVLRVTLVTKKRIERQAKTLGCTTTDLLVICSRPPLDDYHKDMVLENGE